MTAQSNNLEFIGLNRRSLRSVHCNTVTLTLARQKDFNPNAPTVISSITLWTPINILCGVQNVEETTKDMTLNSTAAEKP